MGVGRITLEINGKLIRNFTNQAVPAAARRRAALAGRGAHPLRRNRLTFIAIDKLRNESKVTITIYHRRPRRHHH